LTAEIAVIGKWLPPMPPSVRPPWHNEVNRAIPHFSPSLTAVTLGMMDAAYFLGRRELLDFFNELLVLQLQKIEQTASGAIACQLTEYIFPNSIPMSKYVLCVVTTKVRSLYQSNERL
jgi:hypothetical protein